MTANNWVTQSLWDNQVQNTNGDMLQIPWDAFFQPGHSGGAGGF